MRSSPSSALLQRGILSQRGKESYRKSGSYQRVHNRGGRAEKAFLQPPVGRVFSNRTAQKSDMPRNSWHSASERPPKTKKRFGTGSFTTPFLYPVQKSNGNRRGENATFSAILRSRICPGNDLGPGGAEAAACRGMNRIRDFRGSPRPHYSGVWFVLRGNLGIDLADCAIIAENLVADLRDVLVTVSRECHCAGCLRLPFLCVWSVSADVDGVGSGVVGHREPHRFAEVTDLGVVVSADAVGFDLHGLASVTKCFIG